MCRPGGRIGLASWTPEGFVGGMLAPSASTSPPAGALPATRWGTEAVVAELLGDEVTDVASVTETVRQRFDTAEEFADLFLTYYGPTYSAAGRLDEEGRAALRADLVDLARSFDRGDRRRRGPGLGVPHRHRHPALTTTPPPLTKGNVMNIKSISTRTRFVVLVAAGLIVASGRPPAPRT